MYLHQPFTPVGMRWAISSRLCFLSMFRTHIASNVSVLADPIFHTSLSHIVQLVSLRFDLPIVRGATEHVRAWRLSFCQWTWWYCLIVSSSSYLAEMCSSSKLRSFLWLLHINGWRQRFVIAPTADDSVVGSPAYPRSQKGDQLAGVVLLQNGEVAVESVITSWTLYIGSSSSDVQLQVCITKHIACSQPVWM